MYCIFDLLTKKRIEKGMSEQEMFSYFRHHKIKKKHLLFFAKNCSLEAAKPYQKVFADPPFNIGKEYGQDIDDSKSCSDYLDKRLTFRSWIAVNRNYAPVAYRLNPTHYGLLYYVKGMAPKTFHEEEYTTIQTCRHCVGEIRDYGGYRKTLNPNGICLEMDWMRDRRLQYSFSDLLNK